MKTNMLKSIPLLAAAVLVALTSCAKNNNDRTKEMNQNNTNAIVCYFSATGTTEKAARRIAAAAGADIHEIVPEKKYTSADLNCRDSSSRSYVEMHNRSFRPALADSATDLSGYSVIFIGYPNWWNSAPTVINTFIEHNDLSGKTIIPFMTSGGSNITNSENELHEAYPNLIWGKGMLMNNASDAEISAWIDKSMK